MAGEWRSSTWGEEISLEYGKALRGHDVGRGQYRVFGSNGPIGWTSEALAPGPGVILGRKGAYRGVQYSPEPFFAIDTAYYVAPKTNLDMRWLYYAINHYKLGEIDDGSPIPSTTRAAVYMVDLDVPPLSEQRIIAHFLGTLDDKIELSRRMSETLESMALALFQSWFVDFGPVRAKVEDRDPALTSAIAELFPDTFESSALGEIPKGWEVGQIGDVVEHLRVQENPVASPDLRYHHFSLPAFDDGRYPKLEYGVDIKSSKWRVPSGVVLLSKLNPEIERVWLVDVLPGERAVCSTEFLVLGARPPFVRSYAYCLMRSRTFRQQIEGLVTGTSKSHQRAQVEAVLALTFVRPPRAAVAAVERSADDLLSKSLACRRESQVLAALRDALLPELISGRIRVDDAERILGSAT
jgi:type I restriction enzyme S subunit